MSAEVRQVNAWFIYMRHGRRLSENTLGDRKTANRVWLVCKAPKLATGATNIKRWKDLVVDNGVDVCWPSFSIDKRAANES